MDRIIHINPDKLAKNPAFSQAVLTQGAGKTLYIGGQNAVDEKGTLTGKDDLQAQTRQAMQNIQVILAECKATFEHVVKLTVYMVQGQSLPTAFQAAQSFMSNGPAPPAVSVLVVAGLAHPDFLIEIEATAFIPE